MNFCDSCTWWEFTYQCDPYKFGTCENPAVSSFMRIVDEVDLDEPTIFTANCFGCIYHERKGTTKTVTQINPNDID